MTCGLDVQSFEPWFFTIVFIYRRESSLRSYIDFGSSFDSNVEVELYGSLAYQGRAFGFLLISFAKVCKCCS